MSLSKGEYELFGFAGPLVLLIAWGMLKAKRKGIVAGQIQQSGEFVGEELASGWLLRHFKPSERSALRAQLNGYRIGTLVFAWAVFVLTSANLLPDAWIHAHCEPQTQAAVSVATSAWYSLLNELADSLVVLNGSIAFAFALVPLKGIVAAATARYQRTRPVSKRFLFWSRMLPAVVCLLSGYTLGMLLTLLTAVAFYGLPPSVAVWQGLSLVGWQHWQIAIQYRGMSDFDRYVLLLQTSVPKLMVSVVTGAMLEVGVMAAVVVQPVRWLRNAWGAGAAFISYVALVIFMTSRSELATVLFVYRQLGTPPAWGWAIVPLGIAAAMLVLGSLFNDRLEV
jgi:hypothetical protein